VCGGKGCGHRWAQPPKEDWISQAARDICEQPTHLSNGLVAAIIARHAKTAPAQQFAHREKIRGIQERLLSLSDYACDSLDRRFNHLRRLEALYAMLVAEIARIEEAEKQAL
jgi:hypothetical protein